VFDQLRNFSQAQMILKKEVVYMWEKFYYFKTKHMSLPKKRGQYGSKRPKKYSKTSEIPPVKPLFVVCARPMRDVFEAGGITCKKVN